MQECSLFSTLSPAFIFCRLSDDGHSDWWEVVSHCRIDLPFSDQEWCWAPMRVLVGIIGMILNLTIWSGQMNFWLVGSCMHVRSVTQSCPTLRNFMDYSPPGSYVHGTLQARILKWVAISYSRRSSQPRDLTCVYRISFIGRWILHHWATWKGW